MEQPWARYLKGDKIQTKIGLGRVGAYPEFSSNFTKILGKKTGKSREKLEKSGFTQFLA